jgi:prepilin-type N-terminal cleavage/methylation domain-containing protein
MSRTTDAHPSSHRGPSPLRRGAERGFSFIEILIVMGIISVLVGGAVVAITMWTKKQPEFATKNTLTKVKTSIENWKSQFEMYPPSDVTLIGEVAGRGKKGQSPENRINEGIEAIYQALQWPGFKGEPEWDGAKELGNNDEDKLRQAINKHDTVDLKEVLDGWGNPLVYFHRDDYGKYSEGGASYLSMDTVDQELLECEPLPWRNDDGTFINPSTFQLFSMGPDGEPNTDDDITTWTRED